MNLFTTSLTFLFLQELFETVIAQKNYDVRLVGGLSTSEGRVEIYYSSHWGTVCGDGWGNQESMVVCRQLGYEGYSETLAKASFGQGTGLIGLEDVSCTGMETSLSFCSYRTWSNGCNHDEDVGVRCHTESEGSESEGLLRVSVGNAANEGRIEIYHAGEWGTVCFTNWDMPDGLVACRQLGYPGLEMVGLPFGPGTGKIWLDKVHCTGTEKTLAECIHGGWGINNCAHTDDAGVRCTLIPDDVTVRLVDGPSDKEGRLEVYHDYQWGTVCDDGWDSMDSRVVCRQLGFTENGGYFMAADRGYGMVTLVPRPIFLDTVECVGDEDQLEYCIHDGWGVNDCQHSEDVGVQCYVKGSGLSVGAMVGITIGCTVGVLLFCLCCLKCIRRTPSQHTAVPTDDVPRDGAVALGTVHVPREGTPEPNNVQPEADAAGLLPPSYNNITNYKSIELEGIQPEGTYPLQGPYPSPFTPNQQTHPSPLAPSAPYPQTHPSPLAPSAPYPQTHPPPLAPYSQPLAPYPPPSFSGASVAYHYPSADSGVVQSAPLEIPPTSMAYPPGNCNSI